MARRPRILISNDDGIRSRGIRALAAAVQEVGEVIVVAPDRERSAASHAISLHRPLRLVPHGENRWACDGTPTDSVYLGIHHVLKDQRPDLLLSGINHGANLALDVHYSGTVAAALEGTVFNVPSVAFSQVSGSSGDFEAAARFARSIAETVLAEGLPSGILLNVNVPPQEPKGYQITRLGRRGYGKAVQARVDPRGRHYYWIGGDEQAHEDIPGSDCNAIYDHGLVSVTPLHLDLTGFREVEDLRTWSLEGFERKGP